MQHTVETIIRKLKLNAHIPPPEILMVLKDMLKRIEILEKELTSEKTRTKEPKSNRQESNNVPKRKISSDSVSDRTKN